MAPKQTRNSQKDIVLGFGIHQSLALGPKLSLKIAVLKRVLHLRKNNKLVPTRELCGIVFQELKALWSRAGIPIKDDHNCIHKIVALWESYLKIKKIPATRNAERIEKFLLDQNSLFDLSPVDVFLQMQSSRSEIWEEDYHFLELQRLIPQVGAMGTVDRVTFAREKKKAERLSKPRKRNENASFSAPTPNAEEFDSQSSADELDPPSSGDEVDESSFVTSTPRPHSTVSIELPRLSLARALSSTADARNLSVRDQSAMQKTLVEAGNLSPSLVPSSSATVHRQTRRNRLETAAEIKANFIANKPPFAVVHFDSKLIK